MLRRLRLKFICINMLIVLAVLLVMFGLVYQITQQDLEAESVRMMRAVAAEPLRLGRPGEQPEEVRLPYFVLRLGENGEIAPTGGFYDLSDDAFLQELLDAARGTGEDVGVLREYGFRFCFGSGPWGDNIVFADMSSEQSTLNSLVRTCGIIGGVSLLAFLFISIFLARWAVRPVERAWDQQRQFVADASHELKTPLTVILTNAELLQAPGYDGAARARSSENILAMAQQMRGLVESLLELARVDSGSVKTAMAHVDVSRLVSDAVLSFEPLFFEKDLPLDCQVESGIIVKGSESHLRQVVEILLDNALKYADAPGRVTVRLERRGRRCLLSVADPGEAIGQEDLRNIFKRFYRADRARRMDHSYGLGLSIAERIVQEHRGRIWAESREGVNTFWVELPTTEQSKR